MPTKKKNSKNATAADSLVYTVEDAARLLGISRDHAYRAARNNEIPTLRFGRRIVVPKAAFDEMIRAKSSGRMA